MDERAVPTILALMASVAIAWLVSGRRSTRRSGRNAPGLTKRRLHRRNIRAAAYLVDEIGASRSVPEAIGRLRGVDPLQFEEMILTAIQRRGHPIERNARYSGDGGVDGAVRIEGVRYLVQAKRYASAIKPAHVRDFEAVCATEGVRGLFVHTGRTGRASYEALAEGSSVTMISGSNLLKLLSGEPVETPSLSF